MDSRVKDLVKVGDALFSKREGLLTHWQEVAENFYPERANFTSNQMLGSGSESDLLTSTPVLARRELANQISTILRPKTTPWFSLHVANEEIDKDHSARAWLEWASEIQRRAMYDRAAKFVRATKEADNDWVTFGNAVIYVGLNPDMDALLYRNYHLRDCAWAENEMGDIDTFHLRWKPEARQLARKFPKTLHQNVQKCVEKEPHKAISCRHIVVPRTEYDLDPKKARNANFVSLYIDCENESILEETPIGWFPYVVPRWFTISGSQYGWSPATGPSLADARTLQAVTLVLLEAGQKSVDPPMIAVQDAIRSDVNLMAGGITWADIEYDERLGEVLRPITNGHNVPIGIELADRMTRVVADGMFLNKINLPADMGNMTAFEVRKRIEETVRSTAPLFEPAEEDYNGALCDTTFEILQKMKAFGPIDQMPKALLTQDVRFTFSSPLSDMAKEVNAQRFIQGHEMLSMIEQSDPAQAANIKTTTAFRDALKGMGWPEEWLGDEEAVERLRQSIQAKTTAQEGMAGLAGGAQVATQVGKAAKELEAAGIV